MKLSSYLIIGALAAQLFLCVGAVCFAGMFMSREVTTIRLSDKQTTKPLKRFSSVKFVTEYSSGYGSMEISYSNFDFIISESDSASAPTISFSADMEKAVDLSIADNTLTVKFDFAKLTDNPNKAFKVSTSDHTLPISLTLPKGMLKSIYSDSSRDLIIKDMTTDNLKIFGSSYICLTNTSIARLDCDLCLSLMNLDEASVVESSTIGDDAPRSDYGYRNIKLRCADDSRFGQIAINGSQYSSIDVIEARFSSINLLNSSETTNLILPSDVRIEQL